MQSISPMSNVKDFIITTNGHKLTNNTKIIDKRIDRQINRPITKYCYASFFFYTWCTTLKADELKDILQKPV